MMRTMVRSRLESLGREECLALLGRSTVGRVAFDDGEGPTIVPVNFRLDGETVLFRTAEGGRLHRALTAIPAASVRVAFEVDRIDEDAHEGWSVLLRGGAETVAGGGEWPLPWPEGPREAYVRLRPAMIRGRRLTAR